MLEEVAIFNALFKLILSKTFVTSDVGKVRIEVDERSDSILAPFGDHLLPIWIVCLIELPIPNESLSFWE
jgi:hypothetical protein